MHAWKEFLDSLATRGGTIIVLFVLTVAFVFASVVLGLRTGGESKLFAYISGVASGFTSCLTLALTNQRLANGAGKSDRAEDSKL
jgi:hypothetical protein